MRNISITILWVLLLTETLPGQDTLRFCNYKTPTRIGAVTGPFAGPDQLAQLLEGATPDSLTPVLQPLPHRDGLPADGFVLCPVVTLEQYFYGERVYVQIAAWDGGLWGAGFEAVPPNQIGRTDVVPVTLYPSDIALSPPFTRSAIIPPVPEPDILAMCLLGAAIIAATKRL